MTDPFDHIIEDVSALTIGTVESVSPNEIGAVLELDAPHSTALNTGVPSGFPRINSYVLIPNEVGAVVGMITWLGIERSPYPKRKGLKDFDLIDLPFPLRKLSLAPIGTLISRPMGAQQDGDSCPQANFKLERGVTVFPSVGDQLLLPTPLQLRCIIEATGKDRRIQIGTSPLSGAARVTADPDKLFGRHLAILGNTGSGKSCTVAGLIRWSLEAARQERKQLSDGAMGEDAKVANARFVILDPNGEYSKAFLDLPQKPRVFRVSLNDAEQLETVGRDTEQAVQNLLRVPAWLWNSQEWAALVAASYGIQRPMLIRALRQLKSGVGNAIDDEFFAKVCRLLRCRLQQFQNYYNKGPSEYGDFPGKQNLGDNLDGFTAEISDWSQNATSLPSEIVAPLAALGTTVNDLLANKKSGKYWEAFSSVELEAVLVPLKALVDLLPSDGGVSTHTEDAPVPFDVDELPDRVESLASLEGGSALQHVSSMTTRIRTLLSDKRLRNVIAPSNQPSLVQWLDLHVGEDQAGNGELAIIDLALVPSDVIHTIIGVIARLVFEATQRYIKMNAKALPTVLVLEEAHTFINRDFRMEGDTATGAQLCRQTFERIAREGRKFGLGLVLSSQRPSELSATVLAQCNTFLLHRIVNDEDQRLVSRLVPDNVGGLLKELSSLPSRRAILLGWATPVPTLVEVAELPPEQRPRSSDPDFWDVWTGQQERRINWQDIAAEWRGVNADNRNSNDPTDAENDEEEPLVNSSSS